MFFAYLFVLCEVFCRKKVNFNGSSAVLDAERKKVFMLKKKLMVAVMVMAVMVSGVTNVYASTSYSVDTATESFGPAPTPAPTPSPSPAPTPDNKDNGANGTTDTKTDVVPTPDNSKSDTKTDSTTPAPTPSGDSQNSSKPTGSNSEKNRVEYIYVSTPSTTTDVVVPAVKPEANASVKQQTSDGVSSAVRSAWEYKLNNTKKEITLISYIGNKSTVSVPNTVKVNGTPYQVVAYKTLFYGNNKIKTVSFGKSVRTIKGNAYKMFFGCKNLTTVKSLPWDITYLNKTFMGCSNLKKVNGVPASVINANYAFNGCKKLTTVKLSNNLRNAYKIFEGCKKLKSVKGVSKATVKTIKGFYDGVSKEIV